MRADQFQLLFLVAGIGRKFDIDDRTDRGSAPLRLRQKIMSGRQSPDAAIEPFGELIQTSRPTPRQRDNRKDVGECVLDPVVEFAGQRVSNGVLLFEPDDRPAVFQSLLCQKAGYQH